MQAFFANFPNKLTLIFPQNIVRQIFHEMSNILYIPDFPDSPQIFQSMDFSADSPQLYRIRRFSRFSILRKLSADFLRQVFQIFRQIFRFTGSARFSADFSACQIFRQSASMSSFPHKKGLDFSSPFLINNLPPVLPEFFLPNSALPHSMPVWAFWRILF